MELSSEVSRLKAWTLFVLRDRAELLIFSDFLEIFAEFRGKQLLLVWPGSGDGFTLKNPPNIPARRFAPKAENKDEARLLRY
jgi:hypothetical protein